MVSWIQQLSCDPLTPLRQCATPRHPEPHSFPCPVFPSPLPQLFICGRQKFCLIVNNVLLPVPLKVPIGPFLLFLAPPIFALLSVASSSLACPPTLCHFGIVTDTLVLKACPLLSLTLVPADKNPTPPMGMDADSLLEGWYCADLTCPEGTVGPGLPWSNEVCSGP